MLLVEDDAADASMVLNVLERHPDVASSDALSKPDVALELLASGVLEPDLILLDIHMPKIDGFTFVKRLRCIPAMAETPVVFLTTSRLSRDVEAARDVSVVSYVVKPETLADLRVRLDVVIKRIISNTWSSE